MSRLTPARPTRSCLTSNGKHIPSTLLTVSSYTYPIFIKQHKPCTNMGMNVLTHLEGLNTRLCFLSYVLHLSVHCHMTHKLFAFYAVEINIPNWSGEATAV